MYFERQSPDRYSKNNIKPLNINFKEDNHCLPIDNDYSKIKLNLDKEIEGVINSKINSSIQLEWKWVDLDESSFNFSGKINNQNIKKNNIPANRDLKDAISKLFDNRDTNKEKLKVYFSDIENKEIESFEINKNGQAFEFNYYFEQIPIMPYDKQEAIKWRNWFINKEINEKYYLKYDFDKLVKEINNKEGFIDYRAELNTPEVKEYRNTIESKDRLKKSKSFRHLSAPLDLNPDNTGTHIISQLDYQEGENVSFDKIISQLIENTDNQINSVFYYDKYTYSLSQQKNLNAFFDVFKGIEKKHLITVTNLKGKKRANILANNIKIADINNIVKKAPHNRYIILAENKTNYTLWQLPSSIDYIKFNSSQVEPTTSELLVIVFLFLK
ncbi:hypothetical protein PJW08_06395 [Tenacibaculum finnmarkense]|nr:hypothetical protein PJW08_06395 [Tenacibaculum finnmarkense]